MIVRQANGDKHNRQRLCRSLSVQYLQYNKQDTMSVMKTTSGQNTGPKEGEVQLACGCMLPIVAGALNPDRQHKRGTPNCIGSVNDIQVSTVRDTASTTRVIKSSLVHPEQYTGFYGRCVFIDRVVKCFPTAIIKVVTKALCMDNPIKESIIGNIPGAGGVKNCPSENECNKQDTNESQQ